MTQWRAGWNKYKIVTETFYLKLQGINRIRQKQKRSIFEKPAVEKQNGFVSVRSPNLVLCEKGN